MYMYTGERPFCCSVKGCPKAFASEGKLRAHVRAHSKPYTCPIQTCAHHFGYAVDLRRHIEKQHPSYKITSQTLACPILPPRHPGRRPKALGGIKRSTSRDRKQGGGAKNLKSSAIQGKLEI